MRVDVINSFFEFFAGILLTRNIILLWKDKKLRGVSIIPVSFFTLWGIWNLFYYNSLHPSFSFFAGILPVDTIWISMAIRFRKN